MIDAIKAMLGEPDYFGGTSMRKYNVLYHVYGWVQFGEMEGSVRFLRVDCTKLP
ncbi:MAG: hypothetical protein KAG97_05430 [Victivallales bacterium]|nr:hypothetical protein [Victivallales bacterium]